MEEKENKDYPIMPNITDASLAPVPMSGENAKGGPFSGVTANGLFTTIYDNKLMVVIIVLVIIIIGIMAYVVLNKTKVFSAENITDGPPGQQQPALPPGQPQPSNNAAPKQQPSQPQSAPQQKPTQSSAPQQKPANTQPEQPSSQSSSQQSPQQSKPKMASHEQIRQAMKEIDSKQSKSRVEELPTETPRAPEQTQPVRTEPAQTQRPQDDTQQEEEHDAFEIVTHFADNTVNAIEGSPDISTCSYMLSTGKYCTNNSLGNSNRCGRHQEDD
jgi:cell division protein FtsN